MVQNYTIEKKYEIGTLKDYVYLFPVSTTNIAFNVDNGNANITKISASNIIKLNADGGVAYQSNETNEGRLKFSDTLTCSIMEDSVNGLKLAELSALLHDDYYVMFITNDGTRLMPSVDYPLQMTYQINIDGATTSANDLSITFTSYSNIPCLVVDDSVTFQETNEVFKPQCEYRLGGIKNLSLIEVNNVLVSTDKMGRCKAIETVGNKGFSHVDSMEKMFKFTEDYSDNEYKDSLQFTIPIDKFRFYFHYGLTEFTNNRYVALMQDYMGKTYIAGYEFGFTPTYVINSSESYETPNTITITLNHISELSMCDATDIEISSNTDEYYAVVEEFNSQKTYNCISANTAVHTLLKVVTSTGEDTGKYYCLQGYEDVYKSLNIVGTYNEDDTVGNINIKFNSSECINEFSCSFLQYPPSSLNFTTYNETQYITVTSNCDFTIENIPTWLTFSATSGKANEPIKIGITTNQAGVSEGFTQIVQFKTTSGYVQNMTVNYQTPYSWIEPSLFNITAQSSDVIFYINKYSENAPITVVGKSDAILSYSINNGLLTFNVAENNDYVNKRTLQANVMNGKGNIQTVTIVQDHLYKRLVETDGYICENGNSYKRMQVYKGYYEGQETINTGEYEKGDLILSNDSRCKTTLEEWRPDNTQTLCSGSNEYSCERLYVSNDNGLNWEPTSETRFGELIEINSPTCDPNYEWVENGTICVDGNLYKQMSKMYKGEYTGEIKVGTLIETQSKECVDMQDVSISFSYRNPNYVTGTNEYICKVYSNESFTVNFGDGKSDTIFAGNAVEGYDVYHSFNAVEDRNIQIYGSDVSIIYIDPIGEVFSVNIEQGGNLRYVEINKENHGTVTIESFDLKYCERLEQFIIHHHVGANGITYFSFPSNNIFNYFAINNDSTDDCHITTEQLQDVINKTEPLNTENYKGIMDFCDCVNNGVHISCGLDDSTLLAKNWVLSKGCCETEGKQRFQMVDDDLNFTCDKNTFNKLQVMKIQVSTYNNGAWSSWTDTGWYNVGEVVEYNSVDCGYVPPYIYKWELNKDYFVCDGYDAYYAEVKMVSTDGGKTYLIASPLELQKSDQLKESNSKQCGYNEPGKYQERWVIVDGEYLCDQGEGEYNPCGFYVMWTPFGFKNGTFGTNNFTTSLPAICDGDTFTSIDSMFYQMQLLNMFPSFDTSNVVSANMAFKSCAKLNNTVDYNVSSYNFGKLESANQMFMNCYQITAFSSSTLTSLKDASEMFMNCSRLVSIEITGTNAISNANNMIENCGNLRRLTGLNVSGCLGRVSLSTTNVNSLTILHISGLNATINLSLYPYLAQESLEYIIAYATQRGSAMLELKQKQYDMLTDDYKQYMTDNGIGYRII